MSRFLAILLLFLLVPAAGAREARIAVASNFQLPARALARAFDAPGGAGVLFVFGATGRHYAQILHGAPFDAFLAADAARPERLEKAGRAVLGSRFTYALGRLVLWSPRPGLVDENGAVLRGKAFRHLAIANPRLAPYGLAARETLRRLGLWRRLRPRLVRGENIGQTFQFVKSGAAELGFVAASQIARPGTRPGGSLWRVPPELYPPVRQQAVLIRENAVARAFLRFLRSARGRAIIASYGYALPER